MYIYGDSIYQVGDALVRTAQDWMLATRDWLEVLQYGPDIPTGLSRREIIWSRNKSQLYHYLADTPHKYSTPVFLVYALINKAYILDLTPGSSLVEHLVNRGFDVYLLDWGEFEWEDRYTSFEELVLDHIRPAVRQAAQKAQSPDISILGYCMGGTFAAMYTALFEKPVVRNLICLASPLDFSNPGRFMGYDADRLVDTMELVPKSFISWGTRLLDPWGSYVGTFSRLWTKLEDERDAHHWRALYKWATDNVNFPGVAFREWLRDLYQENKLVNGEIILGGRRVELGRIKADLLAIAGTRDYVSPPYQIAPALQYMSSRDKTYLEYQVGHGGVVLGATARDTIYPTIADWLAERSCRCADAQSMAPLH
ncbi:MAG: alpha/beta fold hydrolase [Syntrophomonadaceae bacterium]